MSRLTGGVTIKLGFLTREVADIEKAARLGFDAIELSAGAFGKPGDGPLEVEKVREARRLSGEHGVEITAIAYYDVAFDPPADVTSAYSRVFDAAGTLGVGVIASMSGFDADRDWDGNVQLFAETLRAGG